MNLNNMSRSSTRGIFLSIVLLFSLVLITLPSNVYAQVSISSVGLEETSLLELTNDSTIDVNTLRIWLGSDFNFKSFKTEKGWTGEKNSQGVVIFTSSESIKPGESAKFGVKTDKINPSINWKALDDKDAEIGTGVSIAKDIPPVIKKPEPIIEPVLLEPPDSMTNESIFRIIPDKPNVGSTIRVTGENFGASQEFDFYIDASKIGSFDTDEHGHFMTTMKIPDDQKADRVDFKIKDKDGEEKKLSIRVDEIKSRDPVSENIPLTIKGVPSIVNRGDTLEIFGTGAPGSAITAEINTPEGNIINSRTAKIDSKGNWKLDEPVIVALDTPFGEYSASISDGRDNKLISWTVESDKKIIITPISLKFDPGKILKFNGTALPNIPIELVLEDPFGKEIDSDIIQITSSGVLEYEFQTIQNALEGTYTLIATQGKDKEFIYVGVGPDLPNIPVNLEFDKTSYKTGETALITLSGDSSEIISLLIIDPSDKPKGNSTSITLQPDGRGTHSIDLGGYTAGVYTAVVSKGSTQSSEIFSVGLQTGSGEININTTKIEYHPGDPILILGDTGSNVILTITMIDPNGNEIKLKETFSDKDGKISESSFRIPSDAKSGKWSINAKSGSNFNNIEIDVVTSSGEGMVVSVEDRGSIVGTGNLIAIKVFGAESNSEIEITAVDGEIIAKLEGIITKDGVINQLWPIPAETAPGTYKITVTNPTDTAETTYEIRG